MSVGDEESSGRRPCRTNTRRTSAPTVAGFTPRDSPTRIPAGVMGSPSNSALSTPGRLRRSSRNIPMATPASPRLPLAGPPPPLKIRHDIGGINRCVVRTVCRGNTPSHQVIVRERQKRPSPPPPGRGEGHRGSRGRRPESGSPQDGNCHLTIAHPAVHASSMVDQRTRRRTRRLVQTFASAAPNLDPPRSDDSHLGSTVSTRIGGPACP